jgi:signal transduction histidine kinase
VTRGREGFDERDGLAFFGTLTAGVTHDLNNVLSAIDQARGLLEDLAAGAAATPGRAIDPRRIATVGERVDRQVRKGVRTLSCLNQFAHSLDNADGPFDIGAETENLVSLAGRFADLKKVRLDFTPDQETVRGTGDAFVLQQGLFICLWKILEESEEGDRIKVGVRHDADDAVVSIIASTRCTARKDDSQIQQVTRLMESLDGTCSVSVDDHDGTVFELRFPAA